jgi:hypothetical protein
MSDSVLVLILAGLAFVAGIIFKGKADKGKEADAKVEQARTVEEAGATNAQLEMGARVSRAKDAAAKDVAAGVSGDSPAARLASRLRWSRLRRQWRERHGQPDGDG